MMANEPIMDVKNRITRRELTILKDARDNVLVEKGPGKIVCRYLSVKEVSEGIDEPK